MDQLRVFVSEAELAEVCAEGEESKKSSAKVEATKVDILSDIKPPRKVHGPRALEVWIEHLENLPEFRWHESQYVFVKFQPDKFSPNQRPYGSKSSTSAKKYEEAWNERMLICIDEAKPATLRFEVMQWKCFWDHTSLGKVAIDKSEMAVLMTQDIGSEMLLQLKVCRDGEQVMGKTGPCSLLMKVVVVVDSTKSLLKYHPEVDINSQLDVEHLLETLSVKKSQLPLWRMAFLGSLSGVWMAISICFAFAVAGELLSCPSNWIPLYFGALGMRRRYRACNRARLPHPAAPDHRAPFSCRHTLCYLLRRRILHWQLHVWPSELQWSPIFVFAS